VSDLATPILAIAAPVRGEAPYLLEWIAYHRVLGIKAFLLGDNTGDDDPTSALLQALCSATSHFALIGADGPTFRRNSTSKRSMRPACSRTAYF
jgi:hypothetical protein